MRPMTLADFRWHADRTMYSGELSRTDFCLAFASRGSASDREFLPRIALALKERELLILAWDCEYKTPWNTLSPEERKAQVSEIVVLADALSDGGGP